MDAHQSKSSAAGLWGVLLLGLGCVASARAGESDRAVLPTPHTETLDVVYGKKYGMALTMDVFRPRAKANGAAVVVVMSGGWISSTDLLKVGALFDEPLKRGYTVFAVYHGSQPKYAIPEIIGDVRRSIRFIRSHAADYGIDPNRIGVTGGSAGGHLSLMLGTTGDDGDSKASDPVDRASSRVQAVACFFPPTDFLNYGAEGKNPFKDDKVFKEFGARPAVDVQEYDPESGRFEHVDDPSKFAALMRRISPVTHVTADDAPTMIVHGDADQLVPAQQSESILPLFQKAGVPAELIIKKGAGHAFEGMEPEYARMLDWFDHYLK